MDRIDGELETQPISSVFRVGLSAYAEELVADAQITPSSGKKIMLTWVQIIPAPDNTVDNLVTIKFNGASSNIYKTYVIGREAVFIGNTNQALDIDLENSEKVTVNIHYM
jgi:hypothetical protein